MTDDPKQEGVAIPTADDVRDALERGDTKTLCLYLLSIAPHVPDPALMREIALSLDGAAPGRPAKGLSGAIEDALVFGWVTAEYEAQAGKPAGQSLRAAYAAVAHKHGMSASKVRQAYDRVRAAKKSTAIV